MSFKDILIMKIIKQEINEDNTGRWDAEEQQAFVEGIKLFGYKWKDIANFIGSRTSTQVRSHAQKYFIKLEKGPASNDRGGRKLRNLQETKEILAKNPRRAEVAIQCDEIKSIVDEKKTAEVGTQCEEMYRYGNYSIFSSYQIYFQP